MPINFVFHLSINPSWLFINPTPVQKTPRVLNVVVHIALHTFRLPQAFGFYRLTKSITYALPYCQFSFVHIYTFPYSIHKVNDQYSHTIWIWKNFL